MNTNGNGLLRNMISSLLLSSVLSGAVFVGTANADGTVTTPQNIAPTTWGIARVEQCSGLNGDIAGVTIVIYYFDSGGTKVSISTILLTSAEVVSFFTTTNSSVAGESGSQVKRYRMRVTKWLIDNAKITNVTPES